MHYADVGDIVCLAIALPIIGQIRLRLGQVIEDETIHVIEHRTRRVASLRLRGVLTDDRHGLSINAVRLRLLIETAHARLLELVHAR